MTVLVIAGREQPHSLASVWLHWLQPARPRHRLHVMAINIGENNLAGAAQVLYPPNSVQEVPATVRATWFRFGPSGLPRVDPAAVALASFRRHDLLADPLPASFNLLLRRYLGFTNLVGRQRQDAVERLRATLHPGGLLVVARSESVDATSHGLETRPPEPGVHVASEAE